MLRMFLSLLFVVMSTITSVAIEEKVNVYTRFPPGETTNNIGTFMIKELNKKYQGVYDFRLNVIPGSGGESANQRALADANLGINTMILGSISNFTVNPIFYESKIDRDLEFVPVELFHRSPNVIAVKPELNINTIDELVTHIKNKKIAYTGNTLQATSPLLLDSIFRAHYNIKNVESIRYKTQAEINKNLFIGEVDYAVVNPTDVSGLKFLMISSSERSEYFPDIPTGIESGVTTFNYATSMMFYVPRANLKFVSLIKNELHQICQDSYKLEMIQTQKMTPVCNNDESWLRKEIERERLLVIKHQDSLK